VFGSLGATGQISETTPYAPRSPYSASKVATQHFVKAWHHTYDPWQFPKKLISLVILKAAAGEPISLNGDGLNVRDWLYGDDYVDAPCCWRPAGVSWAAVATRAAKKNAPTSRWWQPSATPSMGCCPLEPPMRA